MRLTISMPIGMNFGWGICGRYLTRELANLCQVELITEDFTLSDVNDIDELNKLSGLSAKKELIETREEQDWPVLQAIQGLNLKPWLMEIKSPLRIGYTFFEKDAIEKTDINIAADYFDIVASGSSWCEEILNNCGYNKTKTILQGIDNTIFHPNEDIKSEYKESFVIFSGGKLELRKGQDLVIRAVKHLQDKYKDVLLINLWYNQWDPSLRTMAYSPYIRFEMPPGDYIKAVNHLLYINGIDPEKVVTLPPQQNIKMAEIYQNTDIGLFPNRCEGGTNLVLMEYMACGKPVIASYLSGHKDILTDINSLPIKSSHPFTLQNPDGHIIYRWDEPILDEIISVLEWAYWHRDEIRTIGNTAGEDLSNLTWTESALQFFELLKNY